MEIAMSLILRWFYHNGERHRAFFREDPASRERELVIAGPDWETAVDTRAPRLEDFSDEMLVDMARSSRAIGPEQNASSTGG
jgi:hypothetical protein